MKKTLLMILAMMACFTVFAQDKPANLLHLNDESFDEIAGKSVLIADFYADWCGPCRKFAPIFQETAAGLSEYTFVKINVDESRKLSVKYGIEYIPYIVAIKDGKVISQYNYSRSTDKDSFARWVKSIK